VSSGQFSLKILGGRGKRFLQLFEPLYLENLLVRTNENLSDVKPRPTNLILRFFDVSNGFWDEKPVFQKSLTGGQVFKRCWLWSKHVQNVCSKLESKVSPEQQSRGNYRKLGEGVVFRYFLKPCISKTVGDIKMCLASKLLWFEISTIWFFMFYHYLLQFLGKKVFLKKKLSGTRFLWYVLTSIFRGRWFWIRCKISKNPTHLWREW